MSIFLLAGCRQESEEAATSQPAARNEEPAARTSVTEQISQPPADGVDALDAPAAPAFLPRSGVVPGWRKIEPVKVYMTAELAGAVTQAEVVRLGYFRVLSAATCVYSADASGDGRQARVLAVETESPVDAYGILTCQSGSDETLKVAGETRVERGDGYHLHSWQGRHYVRLSADSADSAVIEQLTRLMMNITGRIQREDRPPQIDAIPGDAELLQNRWLVRHLGSLPPLAFDYSHPPEPMKVSELLGLGEKTVMCIGRYHVPDGRGPNVVWVVQYPTNKAAYDAQVRYTRHLAGQKDPLSLSTNLLPPHGPYLIGTWTAEEEALQYMMPRIAKLLPF